MVSPGFSRAKYTAWLACEPECGCTLAYIPSWSRAEQLLAAVDRQLLGDVDVFAAAVVALARIAFGVLVGELAALRSITRGLA
jgi:hypothetical protein